MDLIIGGAYQGKCTFAAEKYDLAAEDICDLAVSAPVPARCYVHLEALTRQEDQFSGMIGLGASCKVPDLWI